MSDWQAIHILPEGMVLAVHLFTPGQNTRISLMESLWRRSTGDMRGFSSRYLPHSCMKNTFGPTSEKITLCKVVCFVRVRLLLRHGNPSERQVIWLCRGRLCTRWQPCSVTVFSVCVSVHTCRRKTKKKASCVCVVLVCIPGETTVGSNLLRIWRKTDSTAPEEIKISGAIISLYCAFTLEHSQSYSVISFVVGRAGHKALAGSRVYLTYIKCKRL